MNRTDWSAADYARLLPKTSSSRSATRVTSLSRFMLRNSISIDEICSATAMMSFRVGARRGDRRRLTHKGCSFSTYARQGGVSGHLDFEGTVRASASGTIRPARVASTTFSFSPVAWSTISSGARLSRRWRSHTSLSGARVARELDALIAHRGRPKACDGDAVRIPTAGQQSLIRIKVPHALRRLIVRHAGAPGGEERPNVARQLKQAHLPIVVPSADQAPDHWDARTFATPAAVIPELINCLR